MANEENLKKGKATQFQSGEEAARNGHKGGVASGVSKRRKKTMHQTVNALLDAGLDVGENKFIEEKIKPRLLALGIDAEDATYRDAFVVGILLKAMKGDVRAAEFIRDIAEESPALNLKKQELRLRKNELKFKQEQVIRKPESSTRQSETDAPSGDIDLSALSDEELGDLERLLKKIHPE